MDTSNYVAKYLEMYDDRDPSSLHLHNMECVMEKLPSSALSVSLPTERSATTIKCVVFEFPIYT